ncbi:multidrug efflux system outer membrane protein [Novosphingobium sp. SG751A]|uniref:efflux transporter outer membrane subunit n=1 Tax=Novosphingobium sp. SG751A TaxID=2587000 RepID=UPI0015549F65|nr:efflux transporter outer membrane subunit [Novosphingobium sp. SG751A]NOW46920.1 multidrug efflux system outer membrane protein [Novosphingobium sp. SG751A]
MKNLSLIAALALVVVPAGLEARPRADQPADPAPLPIPAAWPEGEAYVLPGDAALPSYSYAQVLADARLVKVINLALAKNQDLAVAIANIETARNQYLVQRGALFPEIDANGGFTHAGGDGTRVAGATTKGDSASATGTLASYEVDLFGRVRGLTAAAKATYLASEAGSRATRLTLIANVANGWLTYAADRSLLKLAQDTAASAEKSVALTKRRVDGGIGLLADQRKAELTLRTAQADVAAQTNAVAQDINALRLLVGDDVPGDLLPASIDDAAGHLAPVAAGLDSSILLRRPDVAQAEFSLRSAYANVDAARAALYPKITLTGVAGVATTALSSLFSPTNFAWGLTSAASWPIFKGGAAKASYRVSQAQRDAALATYRKTVQNAFADVANVLARRGTIEAQVEAVRAGRDAASDNYRLVNRRYEGGIGTWLDALTAQQSLYSAEKTLVSAQYTRASNLVGLYRAIGGDSAAIARR